MTVNEALNAITNRGYSEDGIYIAEDWRDAIRIVSDAYENGLLAEVVRCKDCKHYDKKDCSDVFGWCNRNGEGCGRTDEWFCADGERK